MAVQSQFIEMFGNPMVDEQKYPLKRLGDCCVINPKRSKVTISDSDPVSFVPMPSVSEEGYLQDVSDSEYGSVKKGFTYFENGDVLFAKITPCMENGKGAIAHDLTNGIGMGSTEFHVLRPIDGKSNSYWLFTLTKLPEFREKAAHNMSGTGGQQRVRADFLENFMIGLPPIELQNDLESICRQADKSKFDGLKSQFIEMFGDTFQNERGWTYKKLPEVSTIVLGSTPSSSNAAFWDGDIKWITPAELSDDSFYLFDSERHITEEGVKSTSLKPFPAGTVILSTRAPIGKTAIAGCEMYCNQGFKNFICDTIINPVYLFYTLRIHNPELQKMGTGSTFLELSKKAIEQISISVPPKELQDEFEQFFKQADKSKYLS